MSRSPDITVVLNAHREGALAHPSVRSARAAVTVAAAAGLTVELIAVLDRADDPTREYFKEYARDDIRVVEADLGDLGLSRNVGVEEACGEYIAFLDCDDLWGSHWLVEALRFSRSYGPRAVCHPQLTLFWGTKNYVWEHLDQESADFNLNDLLVTNAWTALSFTSRAALTEVPYRFSSLGSGIGYEDWGWNCDLIAHGYVHKVVPQTIHFVRAKEQGLLASTDAASCLSVPTDRFREFYRGFREQRSADR